MYVQNNYINISLLLLGVLVGWLILHTNLSFIEF